MTHPTPKTGDIYIMKLDTFGKRVRRHREEMGLYQEDMVAALAKMGIEISQSYWSKCETSDRIPGGEVVAGAAKVLHVSADYLLRLTDDPTPAAERNQTYYSEEADQAATLIDDRPEQRALYLEIVRALTELPPEQVETIRAWTKLSPAQRQLVADLIQQLRSRKDD